MEIEVEWVKKKKQDQSRTLYKCCRFFSFKKKGKKEQNIIWKRNKSYNML